tara:strand:+ start:214 stop:405 length:192 start_codon:yes stop_codon:yes gene_type:complete
VRVAQEIMAHYQHHMASIIIISGDKGIFDVKVNDTLIFSKDAIGRFPEPKEISSELQKALANL